MHSTGRWVWARSPVRRAWARRVRRPAAKGVAAAAALEDGDGAGLVVSDVEADGGATVRSLWQYRHLMASSWIISAQ